MRITNASICHHSTYGKPKRYGNVIFHNQAAAQEIAKTTPATPRIHTINITKLPFMLIDVTSSTLPCPDAHTTHGRH